MGISQNLKNIQESIPSHVTLVAVSKTKPNSQIEEAYASGHKDFGENRVQELLEKSETLPKDIRWHQIGHLQTNKVKFIAPFVYLIHAVDSEKLLREINRRAQENKRTINVLLQFQIAQEESKFGFSKETIFELIDRGFFDQLKSVAIHGVMGMATFTSDETQIRSEFQSLKSIYSLIKPNFSAEFNTLSMGMSGDYPIAIQEGSTMVRVGSKIFGSRNY